MNEIETDHFANDFPSEARSFLDAFYWAKGVANGTSREKIGALRTGHDLSNALIRGAQNDDEELRILEFYVLTKRGII